jgi:hypothetical protein
MRMGQSNAWARVLSVLCLGLTLLLAPPARADDDRGRDLPPPGTTRLIRLGPQALVSEDEHGNLTMVDEGVPGSSRAQAVGFVFGLLFGGATGELLGGRNDVARGVIYGGAAGGAKR